MTWFVGQTNEVASARPIGCEDLEAVLQNPIITAVAGWSEAVEVRAERLLDFVIGHEGNGTPVTIATMFARCHFDPWDSARFMMYVPPITAVRELTRTISRFRIEGEGCPGPERLARAALIHAGRFVDSREGHPETPVARFAEWLAEAFAHWRHYGS
ncbi:MAG TPA: hypothetical protein VEB64_12425 [Azospirillaceae bacterium]|nr:hypothetical protein [Azospirillaceae bacterium]